LGKLKAQNTHGWETEVPGTKQVGLYLKLYVPKITDCRKCFILTLSNDYPDV
jgi:hypothetical protein